MLLSCLKPKERRSIRSAIFSPRGTERCHFGLQFVVTSAVLCFRNGVQGGYAGDDTVKIPLKEMNGEDAKGEAV